MIRRWLLPHDLDVNPVYTYDAADVTIPSATLDNVVGMIMFDDHPDRVRWWWKPWTWFRKPNPIIAWTKPETPSGNYVIQWNASGVITIDYSDDDAEAT